MTQMERPCQDDRTMVMAASRFERQRAQTQGLASQEPASR